MAKEFVLLFIHIFNIWTVDTARLTIQKNQAGIEMSAFILQKNYELGIRFVKKGDAYGAYQKINAFNLC